MAKDSNFRMLKGKANMKQKIGARGIETKAKIS